MKVFFKISLFGAIFCALLLGLSCSLLFIPAIQVRFASLLLRQRFDYVGIEAFRFSPSHLVLKNLQLVTGEAHINLSKLDVYWNLFSLLQRKPFQIKSFEALGLRVDAPSTQDLAQLWQSKPDGTQSPQPKASSASSTSDGLAQTAPKLKTKKSFGILNELSFLDRIAIDQLTFSGHLSSAEGELEFNIKVENLAPKANGLVKIRSALTNTLQDRSFNTVSLDGDLRVHHDNTSQAREIQGDFTAKLDHASQPTSSNFAFSIEPLLNGEYYKLESFILEDDNQASAFLSLEGTLDQALQKINAKFACNIDEQHLYAFFPHKNLPDIVLKIQGTADYQLKQKSLNIAAFLDLDASDLQRLDPSLASLEAVYLRNKLDLKIHPEGLDLKVLNALLQDKSGRSLLKCDLLQPFSARFSKQGLQFNKVQGSLLSLNLTEFPFAYIAPFIKNYKVQASPISASFVAELQGQTVSLIAKAPLTIPNITISQDGEELFKDLSLGAQANIIYDTQSLIIDYPSCKLTQGPRAEDLLSCHGKLSISLTKGTQPKSLEATGMVLANLKALLQQEGIKKYYAPQVEGPLFFASSYHCAYELDQKVFTLKQAECALSADLRGPKNEAYLNFEALQSTLFDCSSAVQAPFSANASGPLFKVVLNQLPLSLIEPLGSSLHIGGDSISGTLLLSREDIAFPNKELSQGYYFIWDQALSIKRLCLKQEQETLVNNLDLRLAAEGFLSPRYIKAKWTELNLNFFGSQKAFADSSGQVVLNPQLGLEGLEVLDAKLSMDLPQLLSLQMMPFLNNLEKGKLQFTFYGNFVGQKNFKSLVYLKNLIFVDPFQSIESVYLSLDGQLEGLEAIRFKGPLIVQGPSGKTGLELDGAYKKGANTHLCSLHLDAEHVFINDLLLMQKAVLPEHPTLAQASQAPLPIAAAKADTLAFWNGIEGKFTFNIAALHYQDLIIKKFHLESMLSPSVLLAKVDGTYVGAAFASSLDITFNPKLAKPYTLKTKLELAEFDLATLIVGSKLIPSAPLEGTFKVSAKASSEALNKELLLDELQGTVYMDGKQGSIKTFEATSKTVQAGSKALAIAGAFLGTQVKELDFISQVITFFSYIPYDQCALIIDRGLDKSIDIQKLTLKGPEVYLSGKGRIDYHPSIPFPQQNMTILTRLDAKGKGASLLNSLGLLREKTSSEGYFAGPQFTIRGTPSKPDFTEFYQQLVSPRAQTPSSPQPNKANTAPQEQAAPKDPLQSLLNLFN